MLSVVSVRANALNETIKPDIKSISLDLRQEAKTDVYYFTFTVYAEISALCSRGHSPRSRIRLLIWFVGIRTNKIRHQFL